MSVVVIYKSNTGYTKLYANMLSKALECQMFDLSQVKANTLQAYDTIIFGGGVRASRISGMKSFLKTVGHMSNKTIILFAVGANAKTKENTTLLRSKNLDENNVNYPLFYMQGGFDPEKLSFLLKIVLQKVAKSIKKKETKDPNSLSQEDKDFLSFFQSTHMDVNEKNVQEILAYVQRDIEAN